MVKPLYRRVSPKPGEEAIFVQEHAHAKPPESIGRIAGLANGDAYEEIVARMEVRGEWEAVDRFHRRVVVKDWGGETQTETIGPKF